MSHQKLIIAFVFLLVAAGGYGQSVVGKGAAGRKSAEEVRLLVWNQDTLFGLIDGTGKPVLPCEYEDLTLYGCNVYKEAGYIVAKRNRLWGVLDWNGHQLVPFRYNREPEPIAASKGLFLIPGYEENGGVVDSRGDTVLPFKYLYIECSNNAYICYWCKNDIPSRLVYTKVEMRDDTLADGKIRQVPQTYLEGCLDENCNEVLPPVYRKINVGHSVILVIDTNGYEGLADYSGRWLVAPDPQYEFGMIYCSFHTTIVDKKSKRVGLLSAEGDVLLPVIYQSIDDSYELVNNILLQDTFGLWSIVDTRLQPLTPHRYKELVNLGEMDISDIYWGLLPDGTSELIDTAGNVIQIDPPVLFQDIIPFLFPVVFVDGALQLVNPSGKLLPQRYKASHGGTNSLVSVSADSLHWGVVDRNGKVVVPLRYSAADVNDDGVIFTRRPSGKIDVFSREGEKLLTCRGVMEAHDVLLIENRKKQWAIADKTTGHRISSYFQTLDHIVYCCESSGYWSVFKENGMMGYIDSQGHEIYPCSLDYEMVGGARILWKFIDGGCSCGKLQY